MLIFAKDNILQNQNVKTRTFDVFIFILLEKLALLLFNFLYYYLCMACTSLPISFFLSPFSFLSS